MATGWGTLGRTGRGRGPGAGSATGRVPGSDAGRRGAGTRVRVRRRAAVVLGALLPLLLAGVLPVPGRVAGADPEVAKFLLEQAKKAISLRKWDDAVQKLTRVGEEDPALVEASYLLGTVHEKRGDPSAALAAYRAFRDGCAELEKAGALEKRIAPLKKKADERIAVLGSGEKELDSLQAAFAGRCLAFARKHREADPDIAAFALRRLLAVLPLHPEAEELLGEITGEPSGEAGGALDPGASPIPGVRTWDDILARKAIEAREEISYHRGVMTIDNQDGKIYWLDGKTEAPSLFVYEVEFRVLKVYRAGSLLGLTFARSRTRGAAGPDDWVMAFAEPTRVLVAESREAQNTDLAETAVKPVGPGEWRRLAVAVDGRKVRVYLDGERVLNLSVPGRGDLSGPVGVFHQRCQAEVRVLKLGVKP